MVWNFFFIFQSVEKHLECNKSGDLIWEILKCVSTHYKSD